MVWLILILLIPYIYLLAGIYSSIRKIKPYKPGAPAAVYLSVVVACRNEEKNLPTLLADIERQDYDPGKFELIVVDDNSEDSTFRTASEFKGVKNLKTLRNRLSGKKSAVAEGIRAASGDLIITTDADCRLSQSWLASVSSFWSAGNPDLVAGPVKLTGGKGFFHCFQYLEFLGLQGITAGSAEAGNPVMCNGANLSITRKIYNDCADDLHPGLVSGDDVFLLHSIKKRKGRISWLESEEAAVTTMSADTWFSFLRQRARWISKAGAYSDIYTRLLAIVTFVTILTQLLLLAAGIFNPLFLLVWLAFFVIKSIPDLLLVNNRAVFNKKKNLLRFFLPAQFIYPFYVLSVVIYWFFTRSEYSH